VSAPELSVVCKSCGSEVSPYVTECPYCGARLRKRAPKLELRGEGLEAKRRRRQRRLRFGRGRIEALDAVRPWATIAVIAASCAVLLTERATDEPLVDLGAIAAPVGSDWWRYLAAPFAYLDVGYLFVVAVALAIFAPGIERRLGSVSTLILLLACGGLGMLAADGIETATGDLLVAAGGNGIALGAIASWFALRRAEARGAIDEDYDQIGVAVAAVVILALPLFDDAANVYAGLVGGLVGGLGGMAAARLRPAE
jgi:membrane associated rhomboid family serine protease